MAQIEAFLRTGEAPPPAPEPGPVRRATPAVADPFQPFGPDALDALDPVDPWDPPAAWPGSGSRARGGMVGRSGGLIPVRLRVAWARLQAWSAQGIAAETRRRSARGAPGRARPARRGTGGRGGSARGARRVGQPPSWTPARAVLVTGVLVLMLILPYALARQVSSSSISSGGTDRASAAPAGPGYAFLRVNPSGTPVRWNPCEPIYYQLDLAAAPSWAQGDIVRAIAQISGATGIQFVYSGPTGVFPNQSIPIGLGTAQSPVVIAWATTAQSAGAHLAMDVTQAVGAFPGTTDALARTVPVMAKDPSSGRMVYVSGTMVISSGASSLPAGFGPGADGVLLLHELGRLVGLGEVSDPSEVMSPQAVSDGITGLGSGDRTGLRRLGHGSGCLSVPQHASLFTAL